MMMYALWRLLKGVEKLTGLTLDEILHAPSDKTKAEAVSTNPAPPDSTGV
jgi:hypothetical protein